MLNLVNDFLDYSRIEAGRLDLDRSAVDLVKLTEKAVERCRFPAGKKEIEINFRAPENLPEIGADETKIEQVLNNLLSNAVKFSRVGTSVEVEIEAGENEVVLLVRDSGSGIAPEEAAALFVPFVRGKNKATGGEKSTGLGLAIVKKIVEAHGGTITVETEPEKGSVFRVGLPLKFEEGKN
jgi:signal transduction histidine kinase